MNRRVEAQQDLLPVGPGASRRTLTPGVRTAVGPTHARRTLTPDVRTAVGPTHARRTLTPGVRSAVGPLRAGPRRPAGGGCRDLGGHE
ncbi:hypothetical protein GCM10009600_06930 [Oerskovia paurometabola]